MVDIDQYSKLYNIPVYSIDLFILCSDQVFLLFHFASFRKLIIFIYFFKLTHLTGIGIWFTLVSE